MSYRSQTHPHSKLTSKIFGAAQAVHRELKPGLDEKLYENALCIELADQGIPFQQQSSYPVYYKNHFIGKLIPDLVVNQCVIVDAKVVESFNPAHTSQILGYLNITDLEIGLLLNFKKASLQVKRLANLKQNQS